MYHRAFPFVVMVSLLHAYNALAQTPRTYGEYKAADNAEKRDTLGRLAAHKHTVPPGVLKAVLDDALADWDAETRLTALRAISGRSGGVRFRDTDEIRQRWRDEHQVLLSMVSKVQSLLNDPEERVRRDAVIALVNISYDLAGPKRTVTLSTDVLGRLAERYSGEPSPMVRSEIIKTVALSDGDGRIRSRLIFQGLNDSEASVLMFAATGAAALKDTKALSRVVELLQHPDKGVRLAAASAMAEYGDLALPYLSALNAAVTAEADDIVRKTLQGSIAVMTRRR